MEQKRLLTQHVKFTLNTSLEEISSSNAEVHVSKLRSLTESLIKTTALASWYTVTFFTYRISLQHKKLVLSHCWQWGDVRERLSAVSWGFKRQLSSTGPIRWQQSLQKDQLLGSACFNHHYTHPHICTR